ncbi:hypothetical protein TrRE_jg7973 [Triparma retinervis]|uniref:Homologous-pairing protein 2 homolog n=1 Tax=Triparma retinervis TaxID=2557542 RepID=A0A9W7A767_9STRA|nr:hypothetical protein TrRE_jg7973 [Triparma retinervis]
MITMSTILGSLPKPDENVVVIDTQSTMESSVKSSESSKKSSKLKKKKKDKKKRKGEDGAAGEDRKKKAKYIDDSDEEEGVEIPGAKAATVSVGGSANGPKQEDDAGPPPTPEDPPPVPVPSPPKAKAKAPAPAPTPAPAPAAAPAKKKKTNTGELIVEAIRRECGPMNNTMIAERTRANKSVVDKLVQKFVDKKVIKKKKVGKEGTKAVYYANQNHQDNKVEKVDVSEIQASQAEFESLAAELRTVTAEIQSLKSQKKNSELDAEVKGMEDVVGALQKRVDLCKKAASPTSAAKKKTLLGGKPKKELPSDSKSLKSRINNMRAEWVKRKAKCADFVEMAADGMEKKPKEVMKVVGIDSDESEGVKVPEKYAL